MLLEASENTRAPSGRRSVLLLQGPVGPFFSELEGSLRAAGHLVRRIAFNAGDSLFSSRVHRPERLSLNLTEWESWLRFELTCNPTDCIVLFGSSRPAHKIARQIAQQFNTKVLSLEEGYLRSGYVTAEFDGNNQHSRLTSWRPKNHQPIDAGSVPAPMAMSSSFVAMTVWGAMYYLFRDLFSTASDGYLFHRPSERVVPLAWRWCRHMARRGVARITEFSAQRHLRRKPGYILVPLQVSSDSQIQLAARGWTTKKLVDACLNFLAKADANQRVVFKLHPLERENALITRLIHRKAKSLGLRAERFAVVNSGRIGELTANSSGMVVINSTSGFSALHHNKPLLVLGDAVFRHDEIATTGNSEEDIRSFFQHRQAKASDVIEQFIDTVKSKCLVPGDFYIAAGRKAAVQHIIEKLEQLPLGPASLKKARMSRHSCLHATLAAAAIGLLAGCSTMPAFGPDANAITGKGANRTAVAEDTLPFEVVEVTAATLPEAANTTSFFPASFQSQQFSNADEVVIEGDLLEIKIREVAEDGLFATAGNRETILNVQVSNSGKITVPYAGTFEARGLTITEMRALLMERYQGRAVEPEIAVSITGTEARSTTLLGAVRAPGRINVPSRGVRLLDLIAKGGGVNHAPWEMLISVQRGSASGTVSLADIVSISANNIVILPGDTVNVAHQPRRFAVYGGVSRSSNIEIPTQDATLAYLLAEVGGLNDRVAQASSVFVFRQASSGTATTAYQFDFSRPDVFLLANKFHLKPSDITYVASADAADFQKFVSIIVSPFFGTVSSTSNLGN